MCWRNSKNVYTACKSENVDAAKRELYSAHFNLSGVARASKTNMHRMDDYPPKKAETKIKSCFNFNRVERSFSFRDSFRGCCSDVWHEAKATHSGLNIFSLQIIKCCSHKSWGYDFKLHSCALQIHSSNFGSCTSYKLEKEKLKPPWLTFLQLISPQPSDKNWTILLLNFFVHLLPSDISFSSMPVVTPFSPLT